MSSFDCSNVAVEHFLSETVFLAMCLNVCFEGWVRKKGTFNPLPGPQITYLDQKCAERWQRTCKCNKKVPALDPWRSSRRLSLPFSRWRRRSLFGLKVRLRGSSPPKSLFSESPRGHVIIHLHSSCWAPVPHRSDGTGGARPVCYRRHFSSSFQQSYIIGVTPQWLSE